MCRVQSLVLWFDFSALPYLLRLFIWVLTERASPFSHFPVGSDRAGRRRAVSRGSVFSRLEKRVGVRKRALSSPWPGLPVGEVGRSRKRAPFLLGQAFRSEIGSPFWSVVRFLGRPRSLRVVRNVVCWAELLLGSRSMRDPGFMNPTT